MRPWLTDADGDGTYTWSTSELGAGNYEAKVAHNLSWDESYPANNVPVTVPGDGLVVTFSYVLATHQFTVTTSKPGAQPDLSQAKAYWLDRDTLAVPAVAHPERSRWRLHWSTDGSLKVDADDIGGSSVGLRYDPREVKPGYTTLRLDHADARKILTGQLGLAQYDDAGRLLDATGVQIPGVLDDLYGSSPVVRRDLARRNPHLHAVGSHRPERQAVGRILGCPDAPQRRWVVGRQWFALVEERFVPLRGHGLCAQYGEGRDERRHRPVFRCVDYRLEVLRGGRSR